MKRLRDSVSERPGLWVGGLSVAIAAVALYFLISALAMPEPAAPPGQPQIHMQGIVGQGERGTHVGWRFVADSSELSPDGEQTVYHHVRRAIYYLHGKPAYEMTADEVTVDLRSQNYSASGHVHVWSVRPRGVSDFRTDDVLWSNPLQLLTCPGPVKVVYRGIALSTSHLQVNLQNGTSSLGATVIHSQ